MNLRIGPESLRFRIIEDELAVLRANGCISGETGVAEMCRLAYTVRLAPSGQRPESTTQPALTLTTVQDAQGMHVTLMLSPAALNQLVTGQAGKDGVREFLTFANGDMLTVGLEVDLHSKKGSEKS
ncbi:MAG: hypothetical protein ACMV0J_06220 [Fluviibacter sp.]